MFEVVYLTDSSVQGNGEELVVEIIYGGGWKRLWLCDRDVVYTVA